MANTSATGGYLAPTSAAPANDDALEDILQAALAGIAGLDGSLVRPRFQPGNPKQPEASVDWCAFGVTDTSPEDMPYVAHDGNANGGLGQDNMQRHEDFTALATFYGPNAKGYAERVRDGLYIPQNREELAANLIAFVNTDTIRQVPELVNNQWVKRYDLTIRFRRKVTRAYAVQNIVSADITEHIETLTVHVDVTE